MQLARVVGTVVATLKDPGLASRKLLVIQPVDPSGAALGAPLVAVDGIGVGAGEDVMFVKGREAAFAFLPEVVVADASIVGKVDTVATAEMAPRRAPRRAERALSERSEPGREEAAAPRREPRESGRPPRAKSEGSARGEEPSAH